MPEDRYRIISTKLRGIARNVMIFVDAPFGRREKEVCIPWSLIHGGDALNLRNVMIGQEITIRVFEWKAEQLGFPG